jgi:invasion protein IalB
LRCSIPVIIIERKSKPPGYTGREALPVTTIHEAGVEKNVNSNHAVRVTYMRCRRPFLRRWRYSGHAHRMLVGPI